MSDTTTTGPVVVRFGNDLGVDAIQAWCDLIRDRFGIDPADVAVNDHDCRPTLTITGTVVELHCDTFRRNHRGQQIHSLYPPFDLLVEHVDRLATDLPVDVEGLR